MAHVRSSVGKSKVKVERVKGASPMRRWSNRLASAVKGGEVSEGASTVKGKGKATGQEGVSDSVGEAFVPNWNVSKNDTFKKIATCQEAMHGLAPPLEVERMDFVDDEVLFGKLAGNVMKMASAVPALIRRYSAAKEDGGISAAEFEALRSREQELAEENEALKKRLVAKEAQVEMEKKKRLGLEFENTSLEQQLGDVKTTCNTLSADRRWLIERGMKQSAVYLTHSKEFNEPLAGIYKKLINSGRHDGLMAGYRVHAEGKDPTKHSYHNPLAHEAYVQAIKDMERMSYPYLIALSSSFSKNLSFVKILEPEGLDHAVADELMGTGKRKAEDAGASSKRKGEPKRFVRPKPTSEPVFEASRSGGGSGVQTSSYHIGLGGPTPPVPCHIPGRPSEADIPVDPMVVTPLAVQHPSVVPDVPTASPDAPVAIATNLPDAPDVLAVPDAEVVSHAEGIPDVPDIVM